LIALLQLEVLLRSAIESERCERPKSERKAGEGRERWIAAILDDFEWEQTR
jgi:hypothetical protein